MGWSKTRTGLRELLSTVGNECSLFYSWRFDLGTLPWLAEHIIYFVDTRAILFFVRIRADLLLEHLNSFNSCLVSHLGFCVACFVLSTPIASFFLFTVIFSLS
ncbi:UNVERIFIED_CONTAM: hypothetical protein K2H54_062035 [Gekko kuhli]